MKRLLIVDDDATNRQLFSFLLAKLGYEVEIAVNGSEAVKQATTDAFTAVLMDLKMPVMDGLTAAAMIRDWEKQQPEPQRHLPLIAISAVLLRLENREELREAGFDDFISKTGMTMQSIAETLARWIK